jgi:hypothetical protein
VKPVPNAQVCGLAHHQNRQTSNSSKLFGKQDRRITKLTKKKQKNALHVVMCKYYSSYMVIIYALSSKQASSKHMEDDDVSK